MENVKIISDPAEVVKSTERLPDADEQLLPSESRAARQSRTLDLEARSLAAAAPLDACVGVVNCGLIRTCFAVQEGIDLVLASGPIRVEQVQELVPSIDVLLRLARQVDRFAQFAGRAAESRQGSRHKELPDSASAWLEREAAQLLK